MPALKLSTMIGKADIFRPFIAPGSDLNYLVFQLSNPDNGDRKTYELVIYAINKTDPTPRLLTPSATDWRATSDRPLPGKINMGNFVLDKPTLAKLFNDNPPFDFLGFKAESLGTGKEDKYILYKVYPCDASGNPKFLLAAVTAFLNPSPPR